MYKINQVADMFGISAHALRYYEKEGILPPINRDSGGRRVYTEDNIKWLEVVVCLKATDMPVADIKKIVSLSQEGDSTIDERRTILENHRQLMLAQLERVQYSIKKIDQKIAFYDGKSSC